MSTLNNLVIELYGGPHDGLLVSCPQVPPCCFVLPGLATNPHESVLYHFFESTLLEAGKRRLRYGFIGYQNQAETAAAQLAGSHDGPTQQGDNYDRFD